MSEGRAPTSVVDISSTAFARDPNAAYAQQRDVSPISWQQVYRAFLLTRHEDVARALRSPRLHENDLAAGWKKIGEKVGREYETAAAVFRYAPFIREGKPHRRLRSAIATSIAPFAHAEEIFNRGAGTKLDSLRSRDRFDLAEVMDTLFFDIFAEMIDLPEDRRDSIRPMSKLSFVLEATLSVRQRDSIESAMKVCMQHLTRHVRTVLRRPGATLLHRLYDTLSKFEEDAETATANITAVLLIMGNDAVGACVNFGVHSLLTAPIGHTIPQQRWHKVSDEVIRYSAPVDLLSRSAVEDVEIGGCLIQQGDRVILSMIAANHDPAVIGSDACVVKLRPEIGAGLAFGAGVHVCVGAQMARTVVRQVFGRLAALPPIALDGPAVRGAGKVVRTLESLPVRFR